MLQILGDLVPYAVPVALSPLPIIAAVMLLLAPAGARGGFGFLLGRVATLAALAFVVALLAARLAGPAGPTDRGGWLRIGLGCLLLLGAALVWRRRPRAGEAADLPGWMRSIEGLDAAGALRLGAIVTAVNPKELALVVGAGMITGSAAVPAGQALLLSLVFAGLASLGAAVPLAWAVAAAEGSRAGLGAARDWLVRNNAIVMAAVLVALGAMLVGSGIEAL